MKYLLKEENFSETVYVSDGLSAAYDWKVWTFSAHPGNATILKLKAAAEAEKRVFYFARLPADLEKHCWYPLVDLPDYWTKGALHWVATFTDSEDEGLA